MLVLRIVILPCILILVKSYQDYNWKKYNVGYPREYALDRVFKLMQNYMEFGIIRVQEIKELRWKYEETLEYELGYLVGELVERYKKLVDEVRRSYENIDGTNFAIPNDVLHLVSKLENCQKLYFEIYHLVRMIHELPRKWKYKIVRQRIEVDPLAEKMKQQYEEALKQAEVLKAKRLAKKNAAQKARMKALRPGYTGTTLGPDEINSKPYNIWWPYDYGWELDAYGW